MRRVMSSSVASPALQRFSTLPHKRHIFGNTLLNMEYVFWFSLQILPETFLILRRTERDTITNLRRSSCKVPVILLGVQWILNFLQRFSKSINTSNSTKILLVGAELFHVDRQTDMIKLSVAFAIFRRHLRILLGAHITFICCVCISEQTATLSLHTLRNQFFKYQVESIYCAVRTKSLYKIDMVRLYRAKAIRYWSLPLRSWKTTQLFNILFIILVMLLSNLSQLMYLMLRHRTQTYFRLYNTKER
jgi:hypothetical protein